MNARRVGGVATALAVAWVAVATGEVPGTARGFAGLMRGRVIRSDENGAVVEVTAVDKTWNHNRAKDPSSLVGRAIAIRVEPSVYEHKKEYLSRVRRFVEALRPGAIESFDVNHIGGDGLVFLELTERQTTKQESTGERRAGEKDRRLECARAEERELRRRMERVAAERERRRKDAGRR